MGFRTVVVKSRCKIEHRLNYLVIRGENERRIFLSEIYALLLMSRIVRMPRFLIAATAKTAMPDIKAADNYKSGYGQKI